MGDADMPSPRRIPKAYVGDLSPAGLSRMTWAELMHLVERGLITHEDVRDATYRRMLRMNGGEDPYRHLRTEE